MVFFVLGKIIDARLCCNFGVHAIVHGRDMDTLEGILNANGVRYTENSNPTTCPIHDKGYLFCTFCTVCICICCVTCKYY